jgi:hypothetical protein
MQQSLRPMQGWDVLRARIRFRGELEMSPDAAVSVAMSLPRVEAHSMSSRLCISLLSL